MTGKKPERAERVIAPTLQFTHDKALSPTSRALPFLFQSILGFRCAPPQALCCRPLRGLNRKLYQLDQTFFSLNLLFDDTLVRHLISTLRARPSSAIVTTFNAPID